MQRFSNLSNTLLHCNTADRGHSVDSKCFKYVTAFILMLGACAAPQDGRRAEGESALVEQFLDISLGREGSSVDGKMIRWCAPIGYRVSGFLTPAKSSSLESEFAKISDLTGIPVTRSESANFLVHVPSDRREGDLIIENLPYLSRLNRPLRLRLGRARCFFVLQADSANCIVRADVVLPRQLNTGEFQHCAAEELSQAMGLPNDAGRDSQSLFNEDSEGLFRTETDDLFLKVLYRRELTPGMDREQLRARLPAVLSALGNPP